MHISQKELGRWVDLSAVRDAAELAHRITMAGLEVDSVTEIGRGAEDIVVGRIEAIEAHEKADRLVVCRVDIGDGRLRQIVCGATNMKAGDLVPVALPGSQPAALDFQIGERKVLGVLSEGMLCAEEELGLAEKSDGLWILPADTPVGVPIFQATGLADTHFEIGLTPNRPDCLSHMGVAREVAAIYGATLNLSALDVQPAWEHEGPPVADVADLDVQDAQGCPRYVLAVIEDVVVGPSPAWLRARVRAMGMRSINNIVDVTNVVLADVGQPLHAFDLDRLQGGRIVVRRARAGEQIEAIDHKTYTLDGSDLVIADAERPVAIAGVMGGAGSEVSESTTRVLLECAYFSPTTVRKTAKRLGIHSESSHRFERGIDPAATVRNAAFALQLLLRTQEGNPNVRVRAGALVHDRADLQVREIAFDAALCARILGVAVPDADVARILRAIGAEATARDGGWNVAVPSWRPDLERPIDLVEEVARLWGYDRFVSTLPRAAMGAEHVPHEAGRHGRTIVPRRTLRDHEATRTRLLAAGLSEALNYSFMSVEELDRLQIGAEDPRRTQAPRVANPLTQEHSHMRTTLIPGLLRALEANVAQRATDVALFEVGRRFFGTQEIATLGVLVTGQAVRHFSGRRAWDFFDVKGLLESLGGRGAGQGVWTPCEPAEPFLHPGVQASWSLAGRSLGIVGQMHPAIVAELDLEEPVFVAELDLDALLGVEAVDPRFVPFPRYPAVARDFALLYDKTAAYGAIEGAVQELAATDPAFGELFSTMTLFDVYEGAQVPEGARSLALQVVYRAPDRTLTDDEIARMDARLLQTLAERTGARLR